MDGVYRVVEVDSHKGRIGLTLENVGIVVPEVKVAIRWADDGAVLIALEIHDFTAADKLPPDDLEVAISHND